MLHITRITHIVLCNTNNKSNIIAIYTTIIQYINANNI